MKKPKKVNKYERTQQRKQALEYYQSGEGLYLFRNRSSVASLELPKVSKDGKRWVQPNDTWEGDSYFLTMVPREAVLVKTISEPIKTTNEQVNINESKENVMEEKLILDQPDQVTNTGKVEHSVKNDLPLTENPKKDEDKSKEKLLTEDPLAGVTIIRD